MASDKMTLQLDSSVVETIDRLQATYGERSFEAVIARALGLLEQVEPYLEDGTLLVFDPKAPPGHDLVELVFQPRAALTPG